MRYEIKGGVFPIVVCYLEDGEQMITEKGSLWVWQSPNVKMETSGGGLGKMFSKALSGESMFQNIYTAQGGPAMITFGSSFPGKILPIEIAPGKEIILQKKAFLHQRAVCGWIFILTKSWAPDSSAEKDLSCKDFPETGWPLRRLTENWWNTTWRRENR